MHMDMYTCIFCVLEVFKCASNSLYIFIAFGSVCVFSLRNTDKTFEIYTYVNLDIAGTLEITNRIKQAPNEDIFDFYTAFCAKPLLILL